MKYVPRERCFKLKNLLQRPQMHSLSLFLSRAQTTSRSLRPHIKKKSPSGHPKAINIVLSLYKAFSHPHRKRSLQMLREEILPARYDEETRKSSSSLSLSRAATAQMKFTSVCMRARERGVFISGVSNPAAANKAEDFTALPMRGNLSIKELGAIYCP